MSIFRKRKGNAVVERLVEEELFRRAHDEYNDGVIRDGLWAKSLALCDGDKKKAKGKYLLLRVQSMHDDAFLMQEISNYFDKQQIDIKKSQAIENDQKKTEVRYSPLTAFLYI